MVITLRFHHMRAKTELLGTYTYDLLYAQLEQGPALLLLSQVGECMWHYNACVYMYKEAWIWILCAMCNWCMCELHAICILIFPIQHVLVVFIHNVAFRKVPRHFVVCTDNALKWNRVEQVMQWNSSQDVLWQWTQPSHLVHPGVSQLWTTVDLPMHLMHV